jgi:CubicO group peptidase (beta-lactamase class C family)
LTAPSRGLRRALDEIVAGSEGLVPAVSLAYAHGEEIVTAGWGAEPETLFQAASISKPVTAVLALRLVADGEISLDDGNATPLDPRITLRLLLSHGAALSVFGFAGYARREPLPSPAEILDGSPPANNEPVGSVGVPGVEASYSGGGYMVVQQLIEDTTRAPFASLAADLVFGPLHMESATFAQPLPRTLEPLVAPGFSEGRPIEGGWRVYPELAAAGLWCTPTDLVRFARGVQDAFEGVPDAVIPQQLAAEMLKPQFPGWGLGVGLLGTPEDPWFGHTGGNAGYRCQLVASARRGLAVAVMSNADEGGVLVPQLVGRLAGR